MFGGRKVLHRLVADRLTAAQGAVGLLAPEGADLARRLLGVVVGQLLPHPLKSFVKGILRMHRFDSAQRLADHQSMVGNGRGLCQRVGDRLAVIRACGSGYQSENRHQSFHRSPSHAVAVRPS
jgi:hypothetical protein